MSRLGKVLASIAVCVTLLAALPTGSLAQTGKGRAQKPVVTYGRLAELTPAHLTITLTSGTQKTIALSAQTRYVALTQATAVAGLREGEYVAAYRHDNGDTTPAGRILYDLQPFGQP
jgi:hypothetical protein